MTANDRPAEVPAPMAAAPDGSPPRPWPRAALAWLGALDLAGELRESLPTIRSALVLGGGRAMASDLLLSRPAGGHAATMGASAQWGLEVFLAGAALR